MDLNIVRKANLAIRRGRPFFPEGKICDVFRTNDLIEIGFLSKRCSRDLKGSCIMCDYGAARSTYPVQIYLNEMEHILQALDRSVKILLLCTNGSFLDSQQIKPALFRAILERAGQCAVSMIEIETHYQDVTEEKLAQIKALLPRKSITIEMGLETVQPVYQSSIIMKDIDLDEYIRTIRRIHRFGFGVDINIMVGLPFLSPKEQFDDALHTVQWCAAHGGSPILFPMNIKPYTLLMEAYRAGLYQPISQWMLPLLLDALPENILERVTVAWFGNREEVYDGSGERTVFPAACPDCTAAIREFYDTLPTLSAGSARKARLDGLLNRAASCRCLEKTRETLSEKPEDTFETRYAAFLSWLEERQRIGER